MGEIKYPWNLLNEIFKDTYREDEYGNGENILDDWIYRSNYYWDEGESISKKIRKYILEERAEKYLSNVLSGDEHEVVRLRLNDWVDWSLEKHYKQMPWTQIAKEMGYRSYRTAQDIYDGALSKLKRRERFLMFVPKLSEKERNFLLNTVEGGWSEDWKKLFGMMEVIPGWKEIMGTNIENGTETAEEAADGEKMMGEAAAEGAAATE